MNKISIENVIPNIFSDAGNLDSGIWNSFIEFDRANFYLIEAASGKGKSSLCSYIYGSRNDYSGKIGFDLKDIKKLTSAQWDSIHIRELSLLFQELSLFGELTALENVLLKNSLTQHKTLTQIKDMFERLDIADKTHQKTAKLSWGQQQRVAIIRCLCQPFNFLLLDEPISHLDDKNAATVAQLIAEEALQQQAGIIVTSIGKHLPLEYSKTIIL